MTAPLTRPLLKAQIPAGAADTTDPVVPLDKAPAYAGVLTSASILPHAAKTGADTNSRTIQIINTGQDGLGTTVMASLALVAGVNLVALDEKPMTLSATPANLVFAAGDVLAVKNLHIGTGMTTPIMDIVSTVSRS